jgi:signal transduction histidine kinase
VEEKDLPEKLKIVVFRILQEAFINIAKHSKATAVEVRLRGTKTELELRIADNGVGFDLDEVCRAKKGLGLTSMRERVELTEGDFRIYSADGTTIHIAWPL